MNVKILLIACTAISLASCSTAYRSGQTPDDVYFSPVRVVEEKEDDTEEEQQQDRVDQAEEREIRMATRDRRWRDWDNDCNCSCDYDPYRYGWNYGYYYNPYYYPYPVYSGPIYINPKNDAPRTTNLGGYNPKTLVVSNPKTGETKWSSNIPKTYNTSNNSGSKSGSGISRRILTNSSSNNSSSNNRSYEPARTNTSSSSSSSGSSSGGRSSGAPVSRPGRSN
jgi:hypothetical protein